PVLDDTVFVGELSLTGAVVDVAAPLALALGVARRQPGLILVMPRACAGQAAWVSGLDVCTVDTLSQAVAHLSGREKLARAQAVAISKQTAAMPCLSEVRGQGVARRVLEVAAAGGHSLLMN